MEQLNCFGFNQKRESGHIVSYVTMGSGSKPPKMSKWREFVVSIDLMSTYTHCSSYSDFCIRKLTPPIPRQPNLFEENPPREECPICFLRMPMSNDGVYKACCGQILCLSCTMQSQSRDHKKCPFCRADENVSNEEHIQRIKDRMDKNDPEAFHLLAYYHDIGTRDIAQDSRKAHKLWEQAAELGTRNAHYHLSKSYSVYYNERGVEKDEEKAIFHLETAAIMGDAASRCELGRYEQTMGNWEYAKKHWMLSAAAGCENCMGFRIKEGFLNGVVTEEEYNQTLSKYQKTIEETKSEQRDADRAERKQHDPHHGQCWPGSLDSEIKPY